MELFRNIALAALFLLIFIVLTSGRSFGQSTAGSQKAAPVAHRTAADKAAKEVWLRKKPLPRRCELQPIGDDAEVRVCRAAYRL
jgi:hypothetical protein